MIWTFLTSIEYSDGDRLNKYVGISIVATPSEPWCGRANDAPMARRTAALALLALAALLAVAAGCLDAPAADAGDPARNNGTVEAQAEPEVSFHGDDGEELARLRVTVADTPAERRRGLMDRDALARDEGMLFLYRAEATRRFWMRNTSIPLDMIFVDADRRVVHVAHADVPAPGTSPWELERYGGVAAMYVVEARRGFANRTGVGPGDRLRLHGIAAADDPARSGI